jgi:hypothetical protein
MHAGLRMNKSLYSLSYTCVTAGTAGLFLAGIYLLVRSYIFFWSLNIWNCVFNEKQTNYHPASHT